ncbi:hypothetical protein JVU11DRAFT_12900 [Chiua virens]|nr:hypothetical protein JVU11DRAFT_12900 [Chiua virens]
MQREMERTRDKWVYTLVKPMETVLESRDNMNASAGSSRPRLELEGKAKDDGSADA